jgi:HAD superfamily hydrolase (TIGR01509 family)
MSIKTAIFDMDGTLLDSMKIYETAYNATLRALGYEPRDGLREAVRPLSGTEILRYLQREYAMPQSLEQIETALDEQLFGYYSTTPQLKSGVPRLLETLESRGIPMAVATATKRVHVEAALRRVGIARYFKRIFTCSEENTGKTQPKIFLTAAAFLGAEPRDTYVVEDALHAVTTAKNAGFYVVAVADASAARHRAEIIAAADEFYEDFEGFTL